MFFWYGFFFLERSLNRRIIDPCRTVEVLCQIFYDAYVSICSVLMCVFVLCGHIFFLLHGSGHFFIISH